MIAVLGKAFAKSNIEIAETIRIADHDVLPEVTSDEGEGDAWPAIRKKILSRDILIFGTPIWMGQASSIAKHVLERIDAFLDEPTTRAACPAIRR